MNQRELLKIEMLALQGEAYRNQTITSFGGCLLCKRQFYFHSLEEVIDPLKVEMLTFQGKVYRNQTITIFEVYFLRGNKLKC